MDDSSGLLAAQIARAGLFLIGLGWIADTAKGFTGVAFWAGILCLGLGIALIVAQWFRENDSRPLFRSGLIVDEALIIVVLASQTGGLTGPTLFLLLGGILLAGFDFGARGAWLYAGLGLVAALLNPGGAARFGLQTAVRSGIVLWAGLLGAQIARPSARGARPGAQSTGDTGFFMEQLDRAQYAARTQTQARRESEQELYDERRKLQGLMAVAHRMAVVRRPDELFNTIVECAKEQMQVEASAVLILRGDELFVEWQEGLTDTGASYLQCKVGEGLLGRFLVAGQSCFHYSEADGTAPFKAYPDVGKLALLIPALKATHPQAKQAPLGLDEFHNFLIVPLLTPQEGRPFGLLIAVNRMKGPKFNEHDFGYLQILAADASISIRNLSFLAELERSHYEMIQALAQAIEAKDEYTHGHVARVRSYSVKLARAMGLSSQFIQDLDTAAVLHDVGKISTPDHILMKPGALTDDEFEIMKQHAANSVRILRDIRSVSPDIQKMVLHHHERWDGKGYPEKLAGAQIPLGAQIISVADCYDAMTSDRPYRKGFAPLEALKRMEGGSGTQFNAEILGYFFAMFDYQPQTEGEIRELTRNARQRVGANLLRTPDPQQLASRANLLGASSDPRQKGGRDQVLSLAVAPPPPPPKRRTLEFET